MEDIANECLVTIYHIYIREVNLGLADRTVLWVDDQMDDVFHLTAFEQIRI